jgi:hypothetical protein
VRSIGGKPRTEKYVSTASSKLLQARVVIECVLFQALVRGERDEIGDVRFRLLGLSKKLIVVAALGCVASRTGEYPAQIIGLPHVVREAGAMQSRTEQE